MKTELERAQELKAEFEYYITPDSMGNYIGSTDENEIPLIRLQAKKRLNQLISFEGDSILFACRNIKKAKKIYEEILKCK